MNIRPAQPADLLPLERIVRLVIEHLQSQGIDQWDEHYPTRQDFQNDLTTGTLFVGEQLGQLVGAICLNEIELPGYEGADWQGDSFLVVHRLLISPAAQGQGIGKQLMRQAESLARSMGKTSLRLDCFTQNPTAIAFYESLGYRRCGEATYRKGPFLLYEKLLPVP